MSLKTWSIEWTWKVNIDFHGQARGNLCSEHGEPGTRLRVWEAPTALPMEGATQAPVMEVLHDKEFSKTTPYQEPYSVEH